MTAGVGYRVLALLLAGLLWLAQPGPCPCWLYTLWRIDTATQDPHAGHGDHTGHTEPRPASNDEPGGRARSDGDSLRVGVQAPPAPQPASALLATLAQRTIHWRVLCLTAQASSLWRPAIEPPPPRAPA